MFLWSDEGIILVIKAYSSGYRMIDIFTKKHGRRLGLARPSKNTQFPTFSSVETNYGSRNEQSIGFWQLQRGSNGWIHVSRSAMRISVCQKICFLITQLAPLAVPHEELFGVVEYIARNMQYFSDHETLSAYAYFEFFLLTSTGFGIDPQTRNADMINNLWANGILSRIPRERVELSLEVTGQEICKHAPNYGNLFSGTSNLPFFHEAV
ncbi:MAG: recombination protein O N-terminal domain-containing protein [Holosporales bacterium]|jgi:recombinational DNA repair protein (RecF pathway)|nr:recombination protein O N-terminal domain-containing protein [Holosporales bacterium]